jgi:hypothetical protein
MPKAGMRTDSEPKEQIEPDRDTSMDGGLCRLDQAGIGDLEDDEVVASRHARTDPGLVKGRVSARSIAAWCLWLRGVWRTAVWFLRHRRALGCRSGLLLGHLSGRRRAGAQALADPVFRALEWTSALLSTVRPEVVYPLIKRNMLSALWLLTWSGIRGQ